MHNENVNRVIKLQTAINNQIDSKGEADIELVNDLNNLLESLNSYECELLMTWYNKQSQKEEDIYIQMEIDFLREQEGQLELASQWDM
jgi:hypothetical protein